MEVVVDGAQASKIRDYVRTHRTVEQPVHLDQPGQGRMQEEVDRLGLSDAALCGEPDRIDPEDSLVRRRSDQRFETGHDSGAPALGCLEPAETLLQGRLVYHAIAPTRASDSIAH